MNAILKTYFIVAIFNLCLFLCGSGVAQEIQITGVYQGKSLYIQNPIFSDEQSFCISEVLVNKDIIASNPKVSAIEISFKGMELFTPVFIKISYSKGCIPTVLNPEAVKFHSAFGFRDLQLNDTLLSWKSRGEKVTGTYEIEKLYGDSWALLETIPSKGLFSGSEYEYLPEHKEGSNKFRIKYSQYDPARTLYSEELEFVYYPEPIRIYPFSVSDKLYISRVCDYEITTADGKTVLIGKGKEIQLKGLRRGEYFITIEDQIEKFVKN
jgi:hypothetical protein